MGNPVVPFKELLFVGTLLLFVASGICSGVLVATDWNSMSSGDSFAGLGVLLFLIGAGIGAVVVLLILWTMRWQKRKNKEHVADVAVDGKPSRGKSEKENDDTSQKTYTIHVHHMQEAMNNEGAKISDASLLKKLGLGVKNVCYKMSQMTKRGEAGSGVYSPKHKSWEKTGQSTELSAAPTPRIYVLPPDSPTGKGVHLGNHSRSRSDFAFTGKLGLPDVNILDLADAVHKQTEDDDIEAGLPSEFSDADLHNSDCQAPSPRSLPSLPIVRSIDTHLDAFVRDLDRNERDTSAYMLSVMIEEVLPRPDSGLLKRMLRMSEIPVGAVEGSGEPILHLRIGSECHLSIGLIKLDRRASDVGLTGPHVIRLKPLDGIEMDLDTTCEAIDATEQVTSAFWDLKFQTSHSMTRESGASGTSVSTVLTPIEMTLIFHVHREETDLIGEIEVKKTFMASMRRELVSLDVDQRFKHDDAVLDFVLSKMELISMPSLLTFLELEYNEAKA